MQDEIISLEPSIEDVMDLLADSYSEDKVYHSYFKQYAIGVLHLALNDPFAFKEVLQKIDLIFTSKDLSRVHPDTVFNVLLLLGKEAREILLSKLTIDDFTYIGL